MQLIHGDGNPATREAVVVCLVGATGNEIWKADRPSDGKRECEHSYASPIVYRDDKLALLISHGADYVIAHIKGAGEPTYAECVAFFASASRVCDVYKTQEQKPEDAVANTGKNQ